MFGLEAISHYNGWAMAGAGALIVMLGLAILSFTISQLYRLTALFEKRQEKSVQAVKSVEIIPAAPPTTFDFPLTDFKEAANRCIQQAASIGDIFELRALYAVLADMGWPAPHITIRSFREAGMLVPAGDGLFSWKK